jgi:acetylornithine deacetylase/succinyl-diaminopimelate desuccinylase-like protein
MAALDLARKDRSQALERLKAFLRIPTVSAVPDHRNDMIRGAEWLAERMRASGLSDVRVDRTPGHPVVFGRFASDRRGAPSVLVYGHYDVQPPDPLDLWDTPPFEPTERGGALYARGASDDKGQLLTHVDAAQAYHVAAGSPPVNVIYVFEGEEEVGSPNLEAWLRDHAHDLAADVAVISDTAMVAPNRPSIVYGLRGLAYLEVEVTGPNRDLHSGQFGGAVLNPANALCGMIAALHDADGRVAIPGFYDAVRTLGDNERTELRAVPFDEEGFRTATGKAGSWGEPDFTVLERLGARPSLDVNGLWSGWTGAGAKTVLPSKANAKISMRLVPNQDPEAIARMFSDHLRRIAPDGVSVEVRSLHGGQPALLDRSSAGSRAAARAYEEAFGYPPVYTLEGGTIPVVALLEEVLGLQTVLMGFGLPDDNLHAPNEKLDIANFHRGTETVIAFMAAFAEEKPA